MGLFQKKGNWLLLKLKCSYTVCYLKRNAKFCLRNIPISSFLPRFSPFSSSHGEPRKGRSSSSSSVLFVLVSHLFYSIAGPFCHMSTLRDQWTEVNLACLCIPSMSFLKVFSSRWSSTTPADLSAQLLALSFRKTCPDSIAIAVEFNHQVWNGLVWFLYA